MASLPGCLLPQVLAVLTLQVPDCLLTFRMYSWGSSSQSSSSSSSKQQSGNTTEASRLLMWGFMTFQDELRATPVVTYCNARLVTRGAMYCPCAAQQGQCYRTALDPPLLNIR